MTDAIHVDFIIRYLHHAGYVPSGRVMGTRHQVQAVDPATGHLYIVRASTADECWLRLAAVLGIRVPL